MDKSKKSLIKTIADLFKTERERTDDKIYETVIETVDKMSPGMKGEPGSPGEPGATGSPGEPGTDRIAIAPRRIAGDVSVEKNELVYSQGGLFQAIRRSDGDPENDPGSYECVISGVAEVEFTEQWETRTLDVYARLSDGGIQKASFPMGPRFLKSVAGVKIIEGDWLYNGKHLLIAETDDAVWPDGWTDINLSIKGEQGSRGRRGVPGDQGARGIGIADIGIEQNHIIVELTNGEIKTLNIDYVGGEQPEQPIKSYQGYYDKDSTYIAGDVVTTASGLFLALVNDPGGDLLDSERWAKMLGTLNQPGGFLQAPMVWRGAWRASEYKTSEVVTDEGWLMISNTKTSDRAAPQPTGGEFVPSSLEPLFPPVFAPQSFASADIITIVQRYTFANAGMINGFRYYVPPSLEGSAMRVSVVTDPVGNPNSAIMIPEFTIPTGVGDQWVTKDVNRFSPANQVYDVVMQILPTAGEITFTGDWDYIQDNGGDPGAGQIYHNGGGNTDTIYINETDDAAADRSAELDLLSAGSSIVMTGGLTWQIDVITKTGGVYTATVTPASRAGEQLTTFAFTYYGLVTIDYFTDAAFFTAATGIQSFAIAAVYDPLTALTSDCQMMDLVVQGYAESPDWDFMSVAGDVSASGSSALDSMDYQFDSLSATVTDVSNVWPVDPDTVGVDQVQVRIQHDVSGGLYQFGLSTTAQINATGNSIETRFSLDGGTSWEQQEKESKDGTDRLFTDYLFPLPLDAGPVDLIVQVKKENAANTLDVFFANVWLTRVK